MTLGAAICPMLASPGKEHRLPQQAARHVPRKLGQLRDSRRDVLQVFRPAERKAHALSRRKRIDRDGKLRALDVGEQ